MESDTQDKTQISLYGRNSTFSDYYRQQVFMVWYNNNRPDAGNLLKLIPPDPNGKRPSKFTLNKWVRNEFLLKAMELDNEVISEIDKTLIGNKLQMLERHAASGQKMQDLAWEYLQDNKINSIKMALQFLVKGVEIEREAMSVPKFLKEISQADDDQLLEELKQLMHETALDITPTDV